MAIATINPTTGETLRTFAPLTATEVEDRLAAAASAYRRHRRSTFADRRRMMLEAARILDAEKEAFGRLMVTEMGKPLKAGVDEAAKCAWGCRYYAEHAERFLADERVRDRRDAQLRSRYQPIGPVLAIMPWNFPFWQVFRFAAPALMAGNVGLLKHASNVPQCALAIEDIFRRAGFPEGVLSDPADRPGPGPAGHRGPAGRRGDPHRQHRGRQPRGQRRPGRLIKKTVLELGGSDPFIVMPSADLGRRGRRPRSRRGSSTTASRASRPSASSCTTPMADEFERRFVAGMRGAHRGRPAGPGHRRRPAGHREPGEHDRRRRCERSVQAGARLLTGGRRLDRPGYYYAPTVLAGVTPESPAYHDEVFGPVAILFRVPRHRRGDPDRQRLPLRPRRQRLDQRSGGARPVRGRHRGGDGVHQRHGGVGPAAAVRRREAVGLRPGAVAARASASS